MMWLTQQIVSHAPILIETAMALTTKELNLAFAFLCSTAAIFDVCPRRVMALSTLLYLLLSLS